MTTRSLRLLALATASLTAVAADATTTITATITGVVRDGVDRDGVFGASGADLTGNAFSLVFSIVLDPLTNSVIDAPGILSQNAYRGFGVRSAPSGAALTIGGATWTLSGGNQAYAARALLTPRAAPFSHQVNYFIQGSDGIGIAGGLATNADTFSTVSPTEDFAHALTDADRAYEPSAGFLAYADGAQINFIQQTIAHAADVTAAAVPEPATWAMMLAGFGMVGCAVRRRQRAAPDVLA